MLSNLFQNNVSPLPQDPIFIVGFPRSGTTLLQTLLATQDNIVSFPETHFFDLLSRYLKEEDGIVTCVNKEQFVQGIQKYLLINNADSDFILNCLANGKYSKKNIFEMLVVSYLLNNLSGQDLLKTRWLEKTPNHLFYINEIYKLYPEAKFIFTLRDPIRSFASYKEVRSLWGEEFKPVEVYADIFLSGLDIFEKFKKQNPSSIIVIKLEELVDDHVLMMNKISDFLGINFTPDTLKNFKFESKKIIPPWEIWKKDNICGQVSGSIEKRINKKDLSEFEKYRVSSLLGNAIEKYGYGKENISIPVIDQQNIIDVAELSESIRYFHVLLNEQSVVVAGKDGMLLKERKHIKRCEEIIEQQTDILTKNEELITRNEELLNEKNETINQLNTLLINQKDEILFAKEEMKKLYLDLEKIYNSKSWNILIRLRKIIEFFLPCK